MEGMNTQLRNFLVCLAVVALTVTGAISGHANHHEQIIALFQYHIKDAEQHAKVDAHLKEALVPGLKRQGVPSVGVFEAFDKEKDGHSIWMAASFNSIEDYMAFPSRLVEDSEYVEAASDYHALPTKNDRAYERLEITLMKAFSGWPKTIKPGADKKLFELRNYESFSAYKGYMKVMMFNEGEIDIFNRTGLHGVFFGDVIAGKDMPNLVYMLAFEDMEERDANWKKFVDHPDWKAMAGMEQYKQTVSKIHQTFLIEKPYSSL